jgi:hypothetical protein
VTFGEHSNYKHGSPEFTADPDNFSAGGKIRRLIGKSRAAAGKLVRRFCLDRYRTLKLRMNSQQRSNYMI